MNLKVAVLAPSTLRELDRFYNVITYDVFSIEVKINGVENVGAGF